MLTPTDIHFLVGLLTLISRPEGVELELGSMIFDVIAEEKRDIDITVRAQSEDGNTSVFEGIEVKHHKRPLDVIHVEQLCLKLMDMPAITTPGIVSGSGYTEPAVRKASHYGVTLYELCDWITPMQFAGVTLSDEFMFHEQGYQWVTQPQVRFNPNSHLAESITRQLKPDTPVFDKNGVQLTIASNFQDLSNEVAKRATALAEQQGQPLLLKIGEVRSVSFRVILTDEPFINIGETKIELTEAIVIGEITLFEKIAIPEFKVLVRYEDQLPFVGCALFEMSNGNLAGITIDPSRTIKWITVPVSDRLLKKIYRRQFK